MSDGTELSITWAHALAWRLERHLLEPVGTASAAGVVHRLGAVLAMDEPLAEIAVRTRQGPSQPGGLGQAVVDGSVIKAFAFRGAVHYLSPEDGGVYLALRAAGRQWELPSWVEHYGLAAVAWPDFRAAVRDVLRDGPLTMAELGESLTSRREYAHLGRTFEEGAWTLVKALSWQGDLCLGPSRDRQATFRRLDDNPRWSGVPELDEAGPRAITTYLRTYGPATPGHVQYWFGEGLSAGRKRLQRWWTDLADELVAVDVEGTTAYVVRTDVESLAAARPSDAVRFLPGHDQWVMGVGTKDEHVTPPSLREKVTRKANPVVVGGVVRGTWARNRDDVTVTWLDEAHPPTDALEAETSRLGGILGHDLRLTLVTEARP